MHDRPTAAELVEAVREYLERDVMEATAGRVQFLTRVAINALSTVQRELEVGGAQDAAQHARLVAIFSDNADLRTAEFGTAELEQHLANAIRDDTLTAQQLSDATAHIRATVRDKLEVANPKYLGGA